MSQASIFDAPEGDRRRDEAIRRVGDHAEPDWYEIAHGAIERLAEFGDPFTTDDVWQVLVIADATPPHEPRAMGAAMRRAQREGLIAPTDEYRQSKRPGCHRRPLRVWRSLL